MGIKFVPFVELVAGEVGIVNSGVSTNAGTWSANINLTTYLAGKGVTVPDDCTGIMLFRVNTSPTQRWNGIRNSLGASNAYLLDMWGYSTTASLLSYKTGESIALYTEDNALTKFYIVGFTDAAVNFYDVSGSFPFLLREGTGGWAVRVVGNVPKGASILTAVQGPSPGFKLRVIGDSQDPDAIDNHRAYRLPEHGSVEIKSFTDLPYVGYMHGMLQHPWRSVGFTPTKGSWQVAPVSYPGKRFLYLNSDFSGGSNQFLTRPTTGAGSTFDWGVARNGKQQVVALDANGQFSYFITNSATCNNIWIESAIDDYDTGTAAVTGPLNVTIDTPFPITIFNFNGLIERVTVTDTDGNVYPIKADGQTLTIPKPRAGKYIKPGAVTITTYSATRSASFSSTLAVNAGYSCITMTAQTSGVTNISNSWSTQLSVGDSVYYPTANSTVVNANGTHSTSVTKSWKGYVIYASTGLCRLFKVTKSGSTLTSVLNPPKTERSVKITGSGFGNRPNCVFFRRGRDKGDGTVAGIAAGPHDIGEWSSSTKLGPDAAFYRPCSDGYGSLWMRNPKYRDGGAMRVNFPQSKQFRVEMARHIPSGYSFAGTGESGMGPGGSVNKEWWVQYKNGSGSVGTESDICCLTWVGSNASIAGNASAPPNGVGIVKYDDYVYHDGWFSSGVFIANHPSDPIGGLGKTHYRVTSPTTGTSKTTGSKIISGDVLIHGSGTSVTAANSSFAHAALSSYFTNEFFIRTTNGANSVVSTRSVIAYRNLYIAAADSDCFQCIYVTNNTTLLSSTFCVPIVADLDAWADGEITAFLDEWELENGLYVIVLKPNGTEHVEVL